MNFLQSKNITYAFQMTIFLQCFHMDNKTKPRCKHNKQKHNHNILQNSIYTWIQKHDPTRGKVDFPMGEAKSKLNITLSGLS